MGYTIADPSLKLKFNSVAGELYRTYTFPGFDEITVTGSQMCCIDKNGFHRIWDGKEGHMIPPTWIHMTFAVEEGGTVFKF